MSLSMLVSLRFLLPMKSEPPVESSGWDPQNRVVNPVLLLQAVSSASLATPRGKFLLAGCSIDDSTLGKAVGK